MGSTFKQLLFSNVPLWVAYNMGYRLVDMYTEELISSKSAFDENPQSRSVLEWRIALHKYTMKLFHTIATGYYNFEKPATWDNFPFSSYEHKNFKPTMEDKKVILPSLGVVEPNIEHVGSLSTFSNKLGVLGL